MGYLRFFSVFLSFLISFGVAAAESSTKQMASLRVSPLSMRDGGQLTLVSPNQWYPLAKSLSEYLIKSHEQFTKLYGPIPPTKITLRLIDADTFYAQTGAPRWTNAMFFKNQITIPLSMTEPLEMDDLFRSIRHEYTHAVIHALSKGRCPGWIDEGLAQWSEGSVNPALKPALQRWLYFNPPIPLELLQGGFTKLEMSMVPAAYAQSLFATTTLINSFGFKRISQFFKKLRDGAPKEKAFKGAFGISIAGFEEALGKSLKKWAFLGSGGSWDEWHSPLRETTSAVASAQ